MNRLLLLVLILAIAVAMVLWLWRLRKRRAGREPEAPQGLDGSAALDGPHETSDWFLFLLPLPVAAAASVALVRGQVGLLLANVLAYGLFQSGALLVRYGRGDWELTFGDATLWRRLPPKTLGAGLIALGSGATAWLGAGHPPIIAASFALVTLVGFHLVYGLELPKGLRRGAGHTSTHAEASLHRARHSIAAIEQASREIRQPELDARLASIAALARQILERLGDDPRDLWRARKFVNVYLDGVQRVVDGYAKTHGHVAAPALDARFQHALDTIESAFREQRQVLLERDVEDLDVQIEVLTRQLEREGIL